jgi:oligoendopeptidase F
MKQAEKYLKSDDRTVRKEVFELTESRRKQDSAKLDDIMSQLIQIRTQIARNCGFDSYTDYKFSYRYDYTKEQINQFHESIRTVVTPMIQHFFAQRNKIWKLDEIKPYDFDAPLVAGVDSELFSSTEEMIDKLCLLLHDMNPELEQFIRHMQQIKNLDLETRKNKAP